MRIAVNSEQWWFLQGEFQMKCGLKRKILMERGEVFETVEVEHVEPSLASPEFFKLRLHESISSYFCAVS